MRNKKKIKKKNRSQRSTSSASIQSLFQKAQEAHASGKLPNAEALYRQILTKHPSHPDSLHYLGVIAYQVGNLEQATELINKALEHRSMYPQAHNNLGNISFDRGDYEQAERAYRKALELNPSNAFAYNNLGNSLYRQKRYHEAEHALRNALKIKSDYAEAFSNLGNVLLDQDQQAAAQESFEQALKIRPDYIDAAINLGVLHQGLEDTETAARYFHHVLAQHPNHPEALYHLGRTLLKQDQPQEAIQALQHSIQQKASFAEAHCELGRAYIQEGREVEAMQALKTALSHDPNLAAPLRLLFSLVQSSTFVDQPEMEFHTARDILTFLQDLQPDTPQASLGKARVLKNLQQIQDAEAELQGLIQREPGYAEAHNNLGNLYLVQSKFEQAEEALQKAIEVQPENLEIKYNMAICLAQQNRVDQAESYFEQVVQVKADHLPILKLFGKFLLNYGRMSKALQIFQQALEHSEEDVDLLNNLATAYHKLGNLQKAEETLQKAIAINPNSGLYNNLGSVFKGMGRTEEAKAAYQEALGYTPNSAALYNNLGNALMDQGFLQQAMQELSQALELNKSLHAALGNFLLCSNYVYTHEDKVLSPEDLFAFHRSFGEDIADAYLPQEYSFPQELDPCKPLNIGLVSPDLRTHSVSYFVESFLETIDQRAYRIFCYADVTRPDQVTQRLHSLAYAWRSIVGMPDPVVAEQIKEDEIDILIDLAGHTGQNRLMVFARKPAPIQVTWIGYPNTTGMRAMDYRISDPVADPPGKSDELHTETLARLPKCFLCYRPFEKAPQVMPYMSKSWRGITFGSFNKISKYSEKTIELWSRILQAMPDSRLFLKSKPFEEEETRNHYLECFAAYGIEPDRIIIRAWFPSLQDALAAYNEVDVALDTYPYNGTTTTCEALYMGVPSVTLCGDRHAARVGASLLTAMGFEELIAETEEEYVDKAVALAQDSFRLQRYRSTTRQQMLDSVLCDKKRYARDVEQAFREMWQAYCQDPERFMPRNTSGKLHAPEISADELIDLGHDGQDVDLDIPDLEQEEDEDVWVF